MRVSLLVAVARNGVIGRDGDLPWRLSTDLRRFRRLTMGHHLLMGRKTYESIGRPLPGRTTVVLTRGDWTADGVLTAANPEQALQACSGDDEVFVVGGGEIYRLFLPRVERIYLTRVEAEVPGDVRFEQLSDDAWRVVSEEAFESGERDELPHTFRILERATDATRQPPGTREAAGRQEQER